MNYSEFKTKLKNFILKSFTDDEISVSYEIVLRTNMNAEILKITSEDSNIGITFYPEKLYENCSDEAGFQRIAEEVVTKTYLNFNKGLDLPEFSRNEAEKSITLSLINASKNEALLSKCPYKSFLDLAIIARWRIEGLGSMIIDRNFIKNIGFTDDEILDKGYKNLEKEEFICEPLFSFCENILKGEEITSNERLESEELSNVYIITNKELTDGSKAILSDRFMDRIAEDSGCKSFYVLPSSRHDLLLVEYSETLIAEDLKKIVTEVNEIAVDEMDFLSNHVYKYDCERHELEICK